MKTKTYGTGARINRWIWTLAIAGSLGLSAHDLLASSLPNSLLPMAGTYSINFTTPIAPAVADTQDPAAQQLAGGAGVIGGMATPELALAMPLMW